VIAENDDIDIDLPGNLDSLFGDFDVDRYFAEQEDLPVFEYNVSRAANLSTDAPADHNDGLVSWNEFERSNTPGSSSHRLKEQRGNTKRKRSQSWHNLLDTMYLSDGFQVIRWSSSTAAAIVEHWRATSRVCLRIAVQNGPNQGLGVAVQV
jgi:hypothetical protein